MPRPASDCDRYIQTGTSNHRTASPSVGALRFGCGRVLTAVERTKRTGLHSTPACARQRHQRARERRFQNANTVLAISTQQSTLKSTLEAGRAPAGVDFRETSAVDPGSPRAVVRWRNGRRQRNAFMVDELQRVYRAWEELCANGSRSAQDASADPLTG